MLIAKYSSFLPEKTKQFLVQIGAHEGSEADLLESAGFKAISWVEADPDTFQKLQAHVSERKGALHTTHNALITASSGEERYFYRYSNQGASSSIYQPTDLFNQTFDGVSITKDSIKLPSIALDDFVQAQDILPSALIIDVQGAELEVLKGGHKALESVSVVEVEISQTEIYSEGALFLQVDQLLKNAGFTRITHVPWHGDVLYIRLRDFNWFSYPGLMFTSLLYAVEYYGIKLKHFIPALFDRPQHTIQKLISRLGKGF